MKVNKSIGVILVNLGTPEQPTKNGVKAFLRAFLTDPRVIPLPMLPWRLLLECVVLPLRCQKVAKNYQKVWLKEGSPLRIYGESLAAKLEEIYQQSACDVKVISAMTYGHPDIKTAMAELKKQQIDNVIVIPLYPQYSASTTAAVFDKLNRSLLKQYDLPWLRFIRDYHDLSAYITALKQSIEALWQKLGRQTFLVMSFHGLPVSFIQKGDPYESQCLTTAKLLAEALNLTEDNFQVTFQSRFGKNKWLTPGTDQALIALAQRGIKAVSVICPGFACDCLETLEEISIAAKQNFLAAGGEDFYYIPALNDSESHVKLFLQIIEKNVF